MEYFIIFAFPIDYKRVIIKALISGIILAIQQYYRELARFGNSSFSLGIFKIAAREF